MKCPHCNREGMTTSECLRQTIEKDAVESLLEALGDRREAVEQRLSMIEGYEAMAEENLEIVGSTRKGIEMEFDCAECGETLTVQHECKTERCSECGCVDTIQCSCECHLWTQEQIDEATIRAGKMKELFESPPEKPKSDEEVLRGILKPYGEEHAADLVAEILTHFQLILPLRKEGE